MAAANRLPPSDPLNPLHPRLSHQLPSLSSNYMHKSAFYPLSPLLHSSCHFQHLSISPPHNIHCAFLCPCPDRLSLPSLALSPRHLMCSVMCLSLILSTLATPTEELYTSISAPSISASCLFLPSHCHSKYIDICGAKTQCSSCDDTLTLLKLAENFTVLSSMLLFLPTSTGELRIGNRGVDRWASQAIKVGSLPVTSCSPRPSLGLFFGLRNNKESMTFAMRTYIIQFNSIPPSRFRLVV